MALEGILDKLTVEKDGEFKASNKYDSQVLYGTNEGLAELDRTDLDSEEGLAKYKTLTGDDPKNYSHRKLTFRKDKRLRGGQKDFGAYVDNNFEKITDELDEQTQTQIAYSFCPTKDISGNKAKPYNATRITISDAEETINNIIGNPDKYIKEEMEKETPLMARYIARFAEEFIEIEKSEAQYGALQAIQKYTPAKFITDTKKHLGEQSKEFRKKDSALREKINEKLESAKGLRARSRAKLIEKEYKQLEKLNEEYIDIEMEKRLIQETVSHAITTIKGKYETAPNIYDILKKYPDPKVPSRNERISSRRARQSNENLERRTESTEPTEQTRPSRNASQARTSQNTQQERPQGNQESTQPPQENTSDASQENYQAPTNTEEQAQSNKPTRQARPVRTQRQRQARPQGNQKRTQPAPEETSQENYTAHQEAENQNTQARTRRNETAQEMSPEEIGNYNAEAMNEISEEYEAIKAAKEARTKDREMKQIEIEARRENRNRDMHIEAVEEERKMEKRQEMYVTNFENVIMGKATLNEHKEWDKFGIPILDVTTYNGRQPDEGK